MPWDKVVPDIRRFRQCTSIVVIAMLFTGCATNPSDAVISIQHRVGLS
jgi:hypothetical protein